MICDIVDLDFYEKRFIANYKSMYPYGYNLTSGGNSTVLSELSREKISTSLKKYYSNEANRKKQSAIQKAVKFRADYSRKNTNTEANIPNPLPKYIYFFNRKDGRNGFSVKCYKTGKHKYFSSSKMSLYEKYRKALIFKTQING
jgi:hypothetical protein